MVSIPDIEQWDPAVLQRVKQAALDASHSFHRLNDELVGTRTSLDNWHGDAAASWRLEHDKTIVTVDEQRVEAGVVADIVDTAITDVCWCIDELHDARALPESMGMAIQPDGSVTDSQAGKVADRTEAAIRGRVRAAAESRLKALLAKATATDVEIGNALRAAVADKPLPVPDGAPHTDPAVVLANLQQSADRAVVEQMTKIRGIQSELDSTLAKLVQLPRGSSEFDAANAHARQFKGELAAALDDLGNIPDYSNIDPRELTTSADGTFLINHTENGVNSQIYGRLKNGTGEFFDQAKGTFYTFTDGHLVGTRTPDPGRVTPDDELLFNVVTAAVGAPEAAVAAKAGGEAAFQGFKSLLAREGFDSAAGLTAENVIPKALASAELRSEAAAGNLASHSPSTPLPRAPDQPIGVDHPSPVTGDQHIPIHIESHPTHGPAPAFDLSTDHALALGADPARGGTFVVSEAETGLRIEHELGVNLARAEPGKPYDWVDASGRTYDAVGNFPSKYFDAQWPNLQDQIIRHAQTKAEIVPVDVSKFTAEQQASVRAFVRSLNNANVIIVGGQ